ncbi:YqkE family protein [Effusibacillus pohliae]|uniref:YqkE family protein n=1 Tax=Effusibacillus pohliae TaxID=232270 RepID=UPI00037252D0|nr:YqkE family protein [Effusibacillus pohliae]
MAKKNRSRPMPNPSAEQDKPATLKDVLRPEVVEQLKAQQVELQAAEERRKEEQRRQAEAARKAELKRLENDFEYLFNQSNLDWQKFK